MEHLIHNTTQVMQNDSDNMQKQPLHLIDNTTQVMQNDSDNMQKQPLPRIALVMRAVDPIQPCLMKRVLSISKTMQQEEELFQQYDFFLLVDQSKGKSTHRWKLKAYFKEHNASDLPLPSIFGISEARIRKEFPALSSGYMSEPLVDGTLAAHPTRPFMWQLMTPAIAVFSRYHRDYDYTWVFEDDVWSLGRPLIEMFRRWDEQMKHLGSDLAVFQNRRNGIPYNSRMQIDTQKVSIRF